MIKERLQTYRSALAEFGRPEEANEVVLRRDIHLAPTSESASREAATLFEHGYRGQGAGELQQSLVVGGPAECIELLEQFAELGISRVLFRCALDEKEQAMQTIRLLGEEVIPHFAPKS